MHPNERLDPDHRSVESSDLDPNIYHHRSGNICESLIDGEEELFANMEDFLIYLETCLL